MVFTITNGITELVVRSQCPDLSGYGITTLRYGNAPRHTASISKRLSSATGELASLDLIGQAYALLSAADLHHHPRYRVAASVTANFDCSLITPDVSSLTRRLQNCYLKHHGDNNLVELKFFISFLHNALASRLHLTRHHRSEPNNAALQTRCAQCAVCRLPATCIDHIHDCIGSKVPLRSWSDGVL